MSAYEFFKDFAGPLSTAAAALAAAFVTGLFAYRQAKTAELQADIALDKLKYETFEKRHDVLVASRELLLYCDHCLNVQALIDATTLADHASRISMGKFYFGRQVCRALDVYVRSAQSLRIAHGAVVRAKVDVPGNEEVEHLRDAAHDAFKRAAVLVDAHLEYDLSLNLLKRGSDRRHGLPERLRRIRARRARYAAAWRWLRRLFTRRLGRDLPASVPPEGVTHDRSRVR